VHTVTLPKEMTVNMLSQELDPAILHIITRLTRVAFVYNGPKGMELAPNPRYSEGSKSCRRLI